MDTITIDDLEESYRNDISDLMDVALRRVEKINAPLEVRDSETFTAGEVS